MVVSGLCRMGMLVWQDTPSMFYEDPFNAGISYRHPQEKAQHMHEMQRMIEVILHHEPCYIVVFSRLPRLAEV